MNNVPVSYVVPAGLGVKICRPKPAGLHEQPRCAQTGADSLNAMPQLGT